MIKLLLCFLMIGAGFAANAKETAKKTNVTQSELPTANTKANEKLMQESDGAIKSPKVFFITPKDGATVPSKFKVVMGVEGIKVRSAGEAPDDITSGHHHIIIDGAAIPQGELIPKDAKHVHFGNAQGETELTLPPGDHVLTLQFADGSHRSFGEKLSATIRVKVK